MTTLPDPDLAFLLALIGSAVGIVIYLGWQESSYKTGEDHEKDRD